MCVESPDVAAKSDLRIYGVRGAGSSGRCEQDFREEQVEAIGVSEQGIEVGISLQLESYYDILQGAVGRR